jgi:hypothetical protein
MAMNTWKPAEPGSMPEARTDVLCFDKPSGRKFVASFEFVPRRGTPTDVCWSDEECTYVDVTHWTEIPDTNAL